MSVGISANCTFDSLKRKFYVDSKVAGASDRPITVARIPDKNLNIGGGKYHVSSEDEALFYRKYVDHVLLNKQSDYLTELQLNDGTEPILIDLDFRYPLDTTTRKYSEEHITNIVDLYLDELPKIFQFAGNQTFPIFVFERDSMYKKYKKDDATEVKEVKDGIHIIIGLQMAHKYQMLLRANMIAAAADKDIFTDLNLVKGLDDVFDDKVSAGTSGWQMYGSAKPGCKPYTLSKYFQLTFDDNDGQFQMDERNVGQFLSPSEIHQNFHLLRGRYSNHLKVDLVPNIDRLMAKVGLNKHRTSSSNNNNSAMAKMNGSTSSSGYNGSTDVGALSEIRNAYDLDAAVAAVMKSLRSGEDVVREAHEIAQLLPEKYYKDGESHFDNRLVAFALKNTDPRLFLSWVMLRSKDEHFDYAEIPELYEKWTKYFNVRGENHTTIGSLKYWAKNDAPEAYQAYMRTNFNQMCEELILNYTDGKVARILKQKYGDKFVCSDIKNKTMYCFEGHHWVEDKGNTLRKLVSEDLLLIFSEKGRETLKVFTDLQKGEKGDGDGDEDNNEIDLDDIDVSGKKAKGESDEMSKIKKRMKKIGEVCSKLDSTSTKNNSFTESLEIFYDRKFKPLLNTKKWLMCFNNGVVDIKNKVFRPGHPEDYISLTTRIDYQPMSYYTVDCAAKYLDMVSSIRTFFSQLFPIASLERYMMDHLASVLIGEKIEQVFNIYIGSGSNGKSLLVELMGECMGDYKALAPISMITDKRTTTGSATPELMSLKGARYAVFQEPDKNSPVNEGFIKEITGESKITGRPLFGETETFPLQVNFAACMNSLFDIKGVEDAIWRRLKVVMFLAKFVDKDEKYDDDTKFVFTKDKTLAGKLGEWAPIFMSMLVERAFENQGVVKDCEEVIRFTNEYRQTQDAVQCFIVAKVEDCEGAQTGSQNLYRTFKDWYTCIYNDKKIPKSADLFAAMTKKYGDKKKQLNGKWNGVRIVMEEEKTANNNNNNNGNNNEVENDEEDAGSDGNEHYEVI